MQDPDFMIHSRQIFLHQNQKQRKRKEVLIRTIICLSHWQSTLRGNDPYNEAILCLEGDLISSSNEKKMKENFLQRDNEGHSCLQNVVWSFQRVTLNAVGSETMN